MLKFLDQPGNKTKKTILGMVLALAAGVAALLLYAANAMPTEFRIVRGVTIKAPAPVIFSYLNNHKKMNTWNPWMKLDPKVKTNYSGPEQGIDSVMAWDGNSDVGAGKATITHSVPGFLVRMNLEYYRPLQSTSIADFSLKQVGDETSLEWTILGRHALISRVINIFVDVDKMIGDMFAKGLSDLKAKLEAEMSPAQRS